MALKAKSRFQRVNGADDEPGHAERRSNSLILGLPRLDGACTEIDALLLRRVHKACIEELGVLRAEGRGEGEFCHVSSLAKILGLGQRISTVRLQMLASAKSLADAGLCW